MRFKSIISAIAAILITVTAIFLLPSVYTSEDNIDSGAVPQQHQINCADNRIDSQSGGDCSAYAAAYILRQEGEQTDGKELSAEIKRTFGFVTPNSVAQLLKSHGVEAKAYHGDIGTLKARVADDTPVIVFLSIPGDTHYAVVTGYDEDNFYLADSMAENAGGGQYNRVIGCTEFEEQWKTNTLICNNVYIAAVRE